MTNLFGGYIMDIVLKVIGILLILFGIVDLVTCNIFGLDITGWRWSAWIAGALGYFLYEISDEVS